MQTVNISHLSYFSQEAIINLAFEIYSNNIIANMAETLVSKVASDHFKFQ